MIESNKISPYRIRESSRANKIKLQISASEGLVIVVPRGVRKGDVDQLVRTHSQWINQNLDRLSTRQQYLIEKFGDVRPEVISLPAINTTWRVNYISKDCRCQWKYSADGYLDIFGDLTAAGKVIDKWLTAVARENLQTQLSLVANETGLKYKKIQVRTQTSRWGSCSARGTISLNRNILFLPQESMRYLLIHELCHTRFLNHSREYWLLVEKFCPDYRNLDKMLKDAWQFLPLWATGHSKT